MQALTDVNEASVMCISGVSVLIEHHIEHQPNYWGYNLHLNPSDT